MAATYVTVTNATTNLLSLVGDEGKNRVDIPATAGSNSITIYIRDLLGDSLLCTTLATWITSSKVTVTRGSATLTAAQLTAYIQGADMDRVDYDNDDDAIVDKAESINVANPTSVAAAASPYTVLSTDTFILVDTSAGAVEVDLPAVASSSGRTIVIKDEGGSAATNAITIDPNGAETLDGSATSKTITTNYGYASIFCDGTQWLSSADSFADLAGNLEVTSTAVAFGASPYTVLPTDTHISVDTTAGPVELDLPAVASSTGRTIFIKDSVGLANTDAITIDPNATETIDGAATSKVIDTDYGYMALYCDGTQWLSSSSSVASAAAPRVASRRVEDGDLSAAAGNQSFDFAAALPTTGVFILGTYLDVTEGFTDGAAGVFTADLGVSGGTTDALLDGADIASIAKVAAPLGATPTGWYEGQTLALDIIGTVNVDTATAGAVTAYVIYIEAEKAIIP